MAGSPNSCRERTTVKRGGRELRGDVKTVTHDGWMLVATAPGAEPAEAWPGQIEFVLDPERSNVNLGAPGEDWVTVAYVFNDAG